MSLIVADQLLCHLVGDYFIQSDWMANEKTKKSVAALAHAITYGLPFLFLRPSLAAMLLIVGSHFLIDRFRLARYVCYAKNFLAPRWIEQKHDAGSERLRNYPWAECEATGYHKDRPAWLAVWLLIICDNTMHILLNGIALKYF